MSNKFIAAELQTPCDTLGIAIASATPVIESVYKNRIQVPWRLGELEKDAVLAMFPDAIVQGNVPHDHPVLEVIRNYYDQQMLKQFAKTTGTLILLGTTLRQWVEWCEACPNARICAVFGEQDSRDEMRENRDEEYFNQLKNATDIHRASYYVAQYDEYKVSGLSDLLCSSRTAKISGFCGNLVALNSIYDISVEAMFDYYYWFDAKICYGTFIVCPEICYFDKCPMPNLLVLWKKKDYHDDRYGRFSTATEPYVVMHHTNGVSLGYYHRAATYEPWVKHSAFTSSRHKFRLVNEFVDNKGGYVKFEMHRVTRAGMFVRSSVSNKELIRVFDITRFLKYGELHTFVVSADKFFSWLDACTRATVDSFEIARLLLPGMNAKYKVTVGSEVINKAWKIDHPEFYKLFDFLIFYAALIRSVMYTNLSKSIQIAKKGGLTSFFDSWFTHKYNKLSDWLTRYDKRLFLNKIQNVMYAVPEYFYDGCREDDTLADLRKFREDGMLGKRGSISAKEIWTKFKKLLPKSNAPVVFQEIPDLEPSAPPEDEEPYCFPENHPIADLMEYLRSTLLGLPVNSNFGDYGMFNEKAFRMQLEDYFITVERLEVLSDLSKMQASFDEGWSLKQKTTVKKFAEFERDLDRILLDLDVFRMSLPDSPEILESETVAKVEPVLKHVQKIELVQQPVQASIGDLVRPVASAFNKEIEKMEAQDTAGKLLQAMKCPVMFTDWPFKVPVPECNCLKGKHCPYDTDNSLRKFYHALSLARAKGDHQLSVALHQFLEHKLTIPNGEFAKAEKKMTMDEKRAAMNYHGRKQILPEDFESRGPWINFSEEHFTEARKNFENDTQSEIYMEMAKGGKYLDLLQKAKDALKRIQAPANINNLKVYVGDEKAGAGKTTAIKVFGAHGKGFDVNKHYYISNTHALNDQFKEFIRKDLKRAFGGNRGEWPCGTIHWALTQPLYRYEVIYIDEACAFPMYYLLCVFALAPNSTFILLGDHEQTEFIPEYSAQRLNEQFSKSSKHFLCSEVGNITYRFGENLCKFLRESPLQYNVTSGISKRTKLTYEYWNERTTIPRLKKDFDLVVVFSDLDRTEMIKCNIPCLSVKQSQGQDHSRVALYISTPTLTTMKMLGSRELCVVAFTRAQNHLSLVFDDEGAARMAKNKYSYFQDMLNHFELYQPPLIMESTIETETFIKDHLAPKPEQPLGVKYQQELLEKFAFPRGVYNNYEAAGIMLDPGSAEAPFTIKLNAVMERKPPDEELTLLPMKAGKSTRGKQALNLIYTSLHRKNVSDRNMRRIATLPKEARISQKKIDKVLDKMFPDAKVIYDVKQKELGDLLKLYKKYEQKHILPQFKGDVTSAEFIIRAHLKQQDKIRGWEAAEKNKYGQDIQAWTKQLNIIFARIILNLQRVALANLNEKIIYANGLSDEELQLLIDKWTDQVNRLNFLNLDCVEMDGNQNPATLQIEKSLMHRLMPEFDDRDLYWACRISQPVMCELFQYVNEYRKTSGEPGTLPMNTFLSIIMALSMLDRFHFMVVKGDDIVIAMVHLVYPDLSFASATFTADWKSYITEDYFEFCSMIYAKGTFCYNMATLAQKVLTKRFFEDGTTMLSFHGENERRVKFTQYQQAVLDKLKAWNKNPSIANVVLRKFMYEVAPENVLLEMETIKMAIEQLHAFCNLEWKDFKKTLIKNKRMNY